MYVEVIAETPVRIILVIFILILVLDSSVSKVLDYESLQIGKVEEFFHFEP